MQFRKLGPSGLRVSLVGIGCNNFGRRSDAEESRKVVHKALDLGITLFDTADVYFGDMGTSEEILGKSLGPRRKDAIIATKFGMNAAHGSAGASRRYVMEAVEASLRRLGTDWIDLYQLHTRDPYTPIEETLRALDDLIRQGKVRYIGCSNLPAWRVVEAQWTAKHHGLNAFAACQDEYSLVVRDAEKSLLPAIEAYGMSLLPFFPLAAGLLSGKYKRGEAPAAGTRFAKTPLFQDRYLNDRNLGIAEKLGEFARSRGHTLLDLAFAWLVARPQVASVIAGASTPEQVEQNAKAVEWSLTADDLAEIDKLSGV